MPHPTGKPARNATNPQGKEAGTAEGTKKQMQAIAAEILSVNGSGAVGGGEGRERGLPYTL
jgi:hypothetical protein